MLLLAFGLLAVALGVFNLFHELHARQVDALYTIIALAVGVVWLVCIMLAVGKNPIGVFGTAVIAFLELGVVAQGHFASSPGAIGSFVRMEGLPVATALMGLVLACVLVMMAAIAGWGHIGEYSRQRETLPLLIVAGIGAVLAILEATDNVHLAGQALPGFGKTPAEDGAFVAALTASLWLAGGLWMARMRRTGAVLIAIATFGVCNSFVSLHLAKGGTSLSLIATRSGPIWAVIAAAVTVLAAVSLLAALVIFTLALMPAGRSKPAPPAPAADVSGR